MSDKTTVEQLEELSAKHRGQMWYMTATTVTDQFQSLQLCPNCEQDAASKEQT